MKITAQAHAEALRRITNMRTAWLCRDAQGVVIAVKAYRAEARHLFDDKKCTDFFCPRGPVVFEVVP
jgi:hypothetical protein